MSNIVVHNYKIINGPRKDGKVGGVVCTHYSYLPCLILDAKEYARYHTRVRVVLRKFDQDVVTIDEDGRPTICDEEKFLAGPKADVEYWKKMLHEQTLAPLHRDDLNYMVRIYPEVLRMEYRMFQREFFGR